MNTNEIFACFVFSLILLILIFDFIFRTIYLLKKKQPKPIGFDDIKTVTVLLIVFFTGVLIYLKSGYDRYLGTISEYRDIAELSILDMQANTLTIASLVVALASIILSVLTFYKEKKANQYDEILNQNLSKIKEAEIYMLELADISSLQFIDDSYKDFYAGVISQHLEERLEDHNNYLYTCSRIVLISNILKHISMCNKKDKKLDKYAKIIEYAKQIIEKNPDDSLASKFAHMEIINALYQKIKINLSEDPTFSEDDIKEAKKHISFVLKNTDDEFGYIENLQGLIYYWSGMSKIRCNKKDGIKLINDANEHFIKAIEKNPHNEKFINNRIAVLCQRFKVNGNEDDYKEASRLYYNANVLQKNYHKLHLCYGSLLLEKVKKDIGITNIELAANYTKKRNVDYNAAKLLIKEAKEKINIALQLNRQFANNHYKLSEAILVELVIKKELNENDTDELIDLAKKELEIVEQSEHNKVKGFLFVAHGFYKFIGDPKADKFKIN